MENIIRNIQQRQANKTFITGIDGLGGAGKTTYAQKLEDALKLAGMKVVLLHMDDFIHKRSVRYNKNKAEWDCYYNIQWRYDYVLENIFIPIHKGKEIHHMIEFYDKTQDVYHQRRLDIDADTILMIEGVFIQRPLLRNYFDYVIYLDVPKEKRLSRVLNRDTYLGNRDMILKKYINRYFPAEDKYVTEYNPIEKTDYIVRY